MTNNEDMCKVVVRVTAEDGSITVETPWATKIDDDLYRIENLPFYAYSLSWLDIVHAPYSEEEERPTFQKVVEKSGHRTIRIIFDPPIADGNESMNKLEGLVQMGCTYEGANPSYICVDIPPEVEFKTVSDYLINEKLNFEYADPTSADLFPNDDNAA